MSDKVEWRLQKAEDNEKRLATKAAKEPGMPTKIHVRRKKLYRDARQKLEAQAAERDQKEEIIRRQAAEIFQLQSRLERITAQCEREKKSREHYIEQTNLLQSRLERYEKWFSDNAATLAVHRIGGWYFDEEDAPVEKQSD